ncbi:MAG: hypothetical protein JWM53_2482, partial [bacterium]|nr:hypothetical protein [bacterium]
GQTLEQTFTCMAAVGSRGCGFEHPLESVYAALTNRVENAGSLRDDALWAVVFVINEDDGAAVRRLARTAGRLRATSGTDLLCRSEIREIPRCDLAMGAFPCRRVEDKAACKDDSRQSPGVTIDRNGVPPALDTTLHVFCSTLAN